MSVSAKELEAISSYPHAKLYSLAKEQYRKAVALWETIPWYNRVLTDGPAGRYAETLSSALARIDASKNPDSERKGEAEQNLIIAYIQCRNVVTSIGEYLGNKSVDLFTVVAEPIAHVADMASDAAKDTAAKVGRKLEQITDKASQAARDTQNGLFLAVAAAALFYLASRK